MRRILLFYLRDIAKVIFFDRVQDDTWLKALELHISKFPPEDVCQLFRSYGTNSASPGALIDCVAQLDEKHAQKSRARKLADRTQKILQAIDQFMGATSICIQHSPEISSLVVGGLRCILDVCIRLRARKSQLVPCVNLCGFRLPLSLQTFSSSLHL